ITLGVLKTSNGDILGSFLFLFMKGLLAIIIVILLAKYFLPKFLDKISDSGELLFIFTVAWCFGIASLLLRLGYSAEIGAIAAGLALSNSPYQLQIASRIKPLRDFFLVLFFIVLGSEMNMASFGNIWFPGLILSLFILIGNPIILYFLFRLMKFTRRNSFLSGLTAAQVSEFGFVLLFIGVQTGHILGDEIAIFTMVALITIFISSYLILYNEQIYRFLLPVFNLFGKDKYREQEKEMEGLYDVWVVGHHRIGCNVCEALFQMKKKFAVIDFDPLAIKKLRTKNISCVFGDVADIEFLQDLKFTNTKLVVMTIPTTDDQLNLVYYLKNLKSKTIIIANAYHKSDAKILYDAGVDFVMMPHLLGGSWVASILKKTTWKKKNFSLLKKEQKKTIPESEDFLTHLLT
ncbi:MAG: cation:proton antiporter, partial [Candidatus Magasanikbacteria bacterium]|nr:cation:proton antiporter [Candidatus Magasanikbacteria bacterium]